MRGSTRALRPLVSAVAACALLAASAGCSRTGGRTPERKPAAKDASTPSAGPAGPSTRTSPPAARRRLLSTPSPVPSTASPVPLSQALRSPAVMRPDPGGFDEANALRVARAVTAFGVKRGGSVEERRASEFCQRELEALGYETIVQPVPLPNGKTSRNVIARLPGRSSKRIVLGAHVDSKPPSPGANDNASGCGVVVELARLLSGTRPGHTIDFVILGTEEIIDKDPSHHHYGARRYVAELSSPKEQVAAMLSIDMVGAGDRFHVRTMRGPSALTRLVIAEGAKRGVKVTYVRDPGQTGWSDHEPFELAGVPALWMKWLPDPRYHTARDTAEHLRGSVMRATAVVVLGVIEAVGRGEL